MAERILVLPRESVPGGCRFTGLRPAGPHDRRSLTQAVRRHGQYMDRPMAEADPAFKQLIPYVVVRDGETIFLMQRTHAGADARLHGRATIGVGGHLNPVDGADDPLMAALRREWAEEMDASWEPDFRLRGLLNDDSNPVGAVHIGVVFTVEAAGRPISVREHDKLSGSFVPAADLAAAWDRMETWSRLAAEGLGLVTPEHTALGR